MLGCFCYFISCCLVYFVEKLTDLSYKLAGLPPDVQGLRGATQELNMPRVEGVFITPDQVLDLSKDSSDQVVSTDPSDLSDQRPRDQSVGDDGNRFFIFLHFLWINFHSSIIIDDVSNPQMKVGEDVIGPKAGSPTEVATSIESQERAVDAQGSLDSSTQLPSDQSGDQDGK